MKTGMHRTTGEEITGIEYLTQRIQDAFTVALGSVVLARGYGSRSGDLIDENVDNNFKMQAYENAVDTFKNPENDLDDCEFKSMTIISENDKVTFTVIIKFDGDIVKIRDLTYA